MHIYIFQQRQLFCGVWVCGGGHSSYSQWVQSAVCGSAGEGGVRRRRCFAVLCRVFGVAPLLLTALLLLTVNALCSVGVRVREGGVSKIMLRVGGDTTYLDSECNLQ